MRKRIVLLISVFIYFILIFLVEKVIFMIRYALAGTHVSISQAIAVLYHGLSLDMSTSGYLSIIPAILIILTIWFRKKIITKIYNVYYAIILAIISIIAVADTIVYHYWEFHIDSSVFLYLKKPKETFASASIGEIIIGIIIIIVAFTITYTIYKKIIKKQINNLTYPRSYIKCFFVQLILTLLLFLPIRGGVTVSTMNIGKAYFSDNMFLNQAAVNPLFNMMYSLCKSNNFASQYQFLKKKDSEKIFDKLNANKDLPKSVSILKNDKPNILLFVLESFSGNVTNDSIVAPNINQFKKEGVYFNNFFANSFRTDRGLTSVLCGYPAQPTAAIMKYPKKTMSLPSLPATLQQNGYHDLSFYYGGDADFANMRSFFIGCCKTTDIESDKKFPIKDRLSKWGVPDHVMLDRLYRDLVTKKNQEPFYKTILTLSSHEPFDVPMHKLKEPFPNSVAYSDSCLGVFINKLKKSQLWNNTLVIFVADHCMQSYPQGINNYDPRRFRIPLILIGGAINHPQIISTYGSQNDIAATILSQLNIKHNEFKFSKDLLCDSTTKFAFYSYVNGFSMVDSTSSVIYDNNKNGIISKNGAFDLTKQAKAFFQNMYLDLGSR